MVGTATSTTTPSFLQQLGFGNTGSNTAGARVIQDPANTVTTTAARDQAAQLAANTPDINKLMQDLAGAKNESAVDKAIAAGGALSPALAALNPDMKKGLVAADTTAKVQELLAKDPKLAKLFENPEAVKKALSQSTIPAYFQGLSINLNPKLGEAQIKEFAEAVNSAKPFNGEVIQVVSDGSASTVRTVARGTVLLPQATFGSADVNSVLRINRHGTELVLEIGNLLQSAAPINKVIVPAHLAASTYIAMQIPDPTAPGGMRLESVALAKLPLTGATAEDQTKMESLFTGRLGLDLAHRFLSLKDFAAEQNQAPEALLDKFKVSLSTANHKEAYLGQSGAKNTVSITSLPVLDFDHVKDQSLVVRHGKYDSKLLDTLANEFIAKLSPTLRDELRRSTATHEQILFMALKDTDKMVSVATTRVLQDLTITETAKDGTKRVALLKAGTILTRDQYDLLVAATNKAVENTNYKIEPSIAKSVEQTMSYTVMSTDPAKPSSIQSGIVTCDEKTKVVAVSNRDSGIFADAANTVTASTNAMVNTVANAAPISITATAQAVTYDAAKLKADTVVQATAPTLAAIKAFFDKLPSPELAAKSTSDHLVVKGATSSSSDQTTNNNGTGFLAWLKRKLA